VEDGRAVELRGDPDHPLTSGGLCAKVNSYLEDRLYSPDRVLHPLRRTGPKGAGEFERVSWDEALDAITSRLRRVISESGSEAVLPYSYMGTQGMVNGMSMDRRFFALLGASRLERTICGDTGQAGYAATMGTSMGIDPEEIVHSRLILLWGTNTVTTNLHLWPLVLRAQRENGAKVVVIDPVRTRTADRADQHVQPMPGTDAALALGMMHVIVDEALFDEEYVEQHTLGFEELRERLLDYPPGRVARLTGLGEQEIVDLARDYATIRPSLIRSLVGMEHRANGAMTFRAIACLPALTGAWRDRGGGLTGLVGGFMRSSLRMDRLSMPELEDLSLREINMMQLGRALTDATMDPPVRALFVYSSNPATTAPAQNLIREGLARADLFTVVHEQFLTDTAHYADYVLPATTQAEQLDLMYSWGHAYLALNQPAVQPQGEAVSNSELFRRLAERLGLDHPALRESDEEIIRSVLDSEHPYLDGITFERLASTGWMKLRLPEDPRPYADGGFPTPSGRVEFVSASMASLGLDPLPAYEPAGESVASDPDLGERFPLALISAKHGLHFLNSSYGGSSRHVAREKGPWLDISTADAELRSISDGDLVVAYNDRGRIELRARVNDRVRRGVVSTPSGWWGSANATGQSVNALTPDGVTTLGRGGDFHDALVEVARVAPDLSSGPGDP